MEQSILKSVKKILGVPPEYEVFDLDIIMHINSVFVTLTDLGVGPHLGFEIEDDSTTWDDYVANDVRVNRVKTFIYLSVKQLFDPAQQSWLIELQNKQLQELAWRINVAQERTDYFHETPGVDISLPVLSRPVVTDEFA